MNNLEEAFEKLWYEKKPEEFEDFLEDQEEELEIKNEPKSPEEPSVEEVSDLCNEWILKTLNPEKSDLKKINSEEFNKKFSEFDKIFLPENTENLTDLWKQIYELWRFKNLFSSCEIWKVFIENKWKKNSFELKSKDWYNIFEVKNNTLFWWYSRFKDRKNEAVETFWFESEDQSLPPYVFIKDGDILDEKILRWLTKVDKVKFEENSYIFWKYYDIIKKSTLWKESTEKAMDKIDPRLFKYTLWFVDSSPQQSWEYSWPWYYWDVWDADIKEPCMDFKLLWIWYTTEEWLEELKKWTYKIEAPKISWRTIEEIEEDILKYKEELNKFKSEKNREIQYKKIKYLETTLEFMKKDWGILKDIKGLSLEKITKDKPIILTLDNKTNLEKIRTLLDWNTVALYTTWNFHWYFETLNAVWKFSKIEIPSINNYFSESDIKEWIKNILEKVFFSADSEYKDAYIKALKEKWFEVEKSWNSWFEARNSYKVIIPTKNQEVVILKIWKELDWKSFKEPKIWIYWFWEVGIMDLDKKLEVKSIMQEVEKKENIKKSQELINDFNDLSQDWITATIKVWWTEKYSFSDIPDNFYTIAEIKVANTQDYRQNRTHTYDYILLDKTKIIWKKFLNIKIPDNYKWIVIWKWWSNIKEVSQELWVRINIK